MPIISSALRATAAPFVAGMLLLAPASTVPEARPAALDDATIVHVLDRTGFGARAEDVARVREIGLDRYLDEQLHPERLSDADVRARLAGLETLALDSSTIAERYYAPLLRERRANKKEVAGKPPDDIDVAAPASLDLAERSRLRELRQNGRLVMDELAAQKILRAVYSSRQLEEVLVDFWFNHFNVFAGKGATRSYITEYEREAIRPYVLGNFRDMLGATAKHPAMLFYLDNWQSKVDGINENYARELLELHTLGVDGGYTQQDIVNVARAFTG